MGEEPDTPVERPESRWAELGLRAIGRSPQAGDLVAFRADGRLLRVAAVGPDAVTLEVVRAAPGDEPQVGARTETTLRDYLEAWGEGTFSAPSEDAEGLPAPQLRRAPRQPRSCGAGRAVPRAGDPFGQAAHSARLPLADAKSTLRYRLRPRVAEPAT